MNDNTFTLEEAIDTINSYISEANAFNKYMDNRADELAKLNKNAKKYKAIADDSSTSESIRKAAANKLDAARAKKREILDTIGDSTDDKQVITNDPKLPFSYRKRGNKGDAHPYANQYAREGKQKWMKAHGNAGEDKLASRKPGRFKTESVEDRISASRLQVFEAFETGVIDETEKSVMLDMLNIENYE